MSPGLLVAHYRVVSKLGEGGMGEVWRATDTKLGRDVAIKILPEALAHDADRMTRFTREAQVLASLNHPNIATLHGVEERALVMELVEGQTLAERIAHGAIALDEALPIAKQIAEALEYAHDKGIIHRDLKPANIKIMPEGRVKVLDFGLAKAMSADSAAGDPASSPTLTMRATLAGTIMGTAAYMSPEQARGQAVDRRADIWAFGVVLYEMLTGRSLFGGPTISDTLAAVLKTDVDIAAVPASVRPIIERCLRKDPRRRWQAIGDVRMVLEEGLPAAAPPAQATLRPSPIPWAIAGVLAAVLIAAGVLLWRAPRPEDHPLTRLSVDLGPDAIPGFNTTVAISPDGRRLVYPVRAPNGRPQLATRLLDQTQPILLPGTESGTDPFFSPDGQWIGFFTANQIRKVPVQGGVPEVMCTTQTNSRGASWGDNGVVVAALQQLAFLSRIEAGGDPKAATKLGAGALAHRWPQVLPGGESVLFTATPSDVDSENAVLAVVSLKTGQTKIVHQGGYYGRYVPSGHLVYVHQGALYGVRFDLKQLETRGTPIALVEDVAANSTTGGGQYAVSGAASGSGTLAYVEGKSGVRNWQIAWLNASGKMESLISTPGLYTLHRFSPDGRKLAFAAASGIFVHDVEHDTTNQITFNMGITPIWAPDGKHIVFRSDTMGGPALGISWIRSDGAGEAQLLLPQSENNRSPWSFTPDGRTMAYHENTAQAGFDIWTVPLDISDPDHPKAGKPELFLATPHDELVPRFSPDGRWIAYRSAETGRSEIFVRPFPASRAGKWQISEGGGIYGIWSQDGRQLFYETEDNRIIVMDYTVDGDSFVPGKRRIWYEKPVFYPGNSNLDLSPDGKRFAVLTMPDELAHPQGSVHVTFLLNFFDELRRRMP
jgi:serine/threonine-protein kinase